MNNINKIIFENYKCFKNRICIDEIKPINIIIGRNNIGKSSLLDIIEFINDPEKHWKNSKTRIFLEKCLQDSEIKRIFSESHSGGIIGKNFYEFGKTFIGKPFAYEIKCKKYSESFSIDKTYINELQIEELYDSKFDSFWSLLANAQPNECKIIKRIFAERNVVPEKENGSMTVDGNGSGITTIISNYLNKAKYNENKVKKDLLKNLNKIMGKDATFIEITTQQVEETDGDIKWEIFLHEEEKGRVALSRSGSGLKTILMILVYTILFPDVEKKELKDYIFLFEELENNLHPALERRLLRYLEEISAKGATIFLTTHSSTTLDCFQNSSDVQIYHLAKIEDGMQLTKMSNLLGKRNCLDDLGIKASEILQSNGIIWVEGPSDRIYINKWIELWSGGKFREGLDYQCVFYGGRLLANITFDEENDDEIFKLFNVNRNSVMLIDSDKTYISKPINNTKKRIRLEYEANNQFCWITQGKEIENYVPKEIIDGHCISTKNPDFGQYDKITDYLNSKKSGEGEKFKDNKIKYAQLYIQDMTYDNMSGILDLDEKMKRLISEIEKWNAE